MGWDLGALTSRRVPAGAGRAMKRFSEELATLPFDELPPRKVDAIVIITNLKDSWKTGYGTFILAKEAGFEVEFSNLYTVDEVPESNFYIMPSVNRFHPFSLPKYKKLLEKVANGATLAISLDDAILVPFEEYFGCKVDYTAEVPEQLAFTMDGETFGIQTCITRRMLNTSGEVLATQADGSPFLIRNKYGKGQVIFVNAPLENEALTPGNGFYKLYRKLAILAGVPLEEKSPSVGITRHRLADGRQLKFYINYADTEQDGMPGNSVKYVIGQ